MLSWGKTTLLLCSFGFLKEFRPSEPYITRFLTTTDKNLTREEVNQEVYPVGTYAHLALLVVIFLVTDLLRCKPVIAVQALAGVCTYVIVIWGKNKIALQVGQLFYGLFIASDIGYCTYMYTVSNEQQYQAVSSYSRIGTLLGRFSSGVISQLIVSLCGSGSASLLVLNYLSLGGVSLACAVALFLPMPPRSIYFHRQRVLINPESEKCLANIPNGKDLGTVNGNNMKNSECVAPLAAMRRDFILAYSNLDVVRWSVWWALATCGYLQVSSYIQILWEASLEERGMNETLYSGAVDAVYTIIGSGVLGLVGRQRMNLAALSSLILTICSMVDGALVLTCAVSTNMWIHYGFYILFKVVYHSMMVLASSEVAKNAPGDCRALVFGFNTFLALILQTVVTVVVASDRGFAWPIRTQFLVYGSYFVAMAMLFLASIVLATIFKPRMPSQKRQTVEEDGL